MKESVSRPATDDWIATVPASVVSAVRGRGAGDRELDGGGGQLFSCLPVRPFHQPFADHKPSLVFAAQARVLPHAMMRANASWRVMNLQETT